MGFTARTTLRAMHARDRAPIHGVVPEGWTPATTPCASCGVETRRSITTAYGPRANPVIVCGECKRNPAINLTAIVAAAVAAR